MSRRQATMNCRTGSHSSCPAPAVRGASYGMWTMLMLVSRSSV